MTLTTIFMTAFSFRKNANFILAASFAAMLALSCTDKDSRLGEDYIATSRQYDIYNATFDLDDIRMDMPEELSGSDNYRFTLGVVKDPVFGTCRKSAALSLVPVENELDFGRNAVLRSFTLKAIADTVSCQDPGQAHILQNINVHALTSPLDFTSGSPEVNYDPGRRISDGVPVYNGQDSLVVAFSSAFASKYLTITEEELADLDKYLARFPGIILSCDEPVGDGGRINMFKLPIDVNGGTIYGSYARLNFTADYGTRTAVDTSFLFYLGPVEKYDFSNVTSTSVNEYPQMALNISEHSSAAMKGQASGTVWVEGGLGLKLVAGAASIKSKILAEAAGHGSVDGIIISKATLKLPFRYTEEDYRKMELYPVTLSPTTRIVDEEGKVKFMGLTDASVSTENPGSIDRSNCVYAPDISYHVQKLLAAEDVLSNYDIWLLPFANETVTSTSSSSDSDLSDYYQQMAYASYYNSMYGGGYGYGGYGSYGYNNYYNYYNYMMMANAMSSSSSTTQTLSMMDLHRFYKAELYGPAATRHPTLSITYALPKGK